MRDLCLFPSSVVRPPSSAVCYLSSVLCPPSSDVMLTNTRRTRIEWCDCDPAGIIFYPRYFEIFDTSTTMLFERALGMTKFQMFKQLKFGGFPLVRTRARFLRPTRFGDDVTVKSSVTFGR